MASTGEELTPDVNDGVAHLPLTRSYQQEMLDESLKRNIIIALDTGSGKTHIAVLRMKIEAEREVNKISWFIAPTVALCEQQREVISTALPVPVGLISGALEPDQWKDAALWQAAISTNRIMISTPQVLLDALRHGYVNLGRDTGLLIFDEAHHAADKHPYNMIMREFYDKCPPRSNTSATAHGIVRPLILGLTASPSFGGNIERAINTIERNLDSTVRTPMRTRAELSGFVHRPVFKHVLYPQVTYNSGPSPSRNVNALAAVIETLNIEDDPYVISLRAKLPKLLPKSVERARLDQRLSKTINKQDSYTHKGLRDFHRAACEICDDLGTWAAEWYVEKVLEQALKSISPHQAVMAEWQNKEKSYLLGILSRVNTHPVSFEPEAILEGTSSKTEALISCLMSEKADWDSRGDVYSGLIFVTRRDSVLALSELLVHHPTTQGVFTVGSLLGSSDSSKRHAFLDITRTLLRQSQAETLRDFRIGEKTLIVSTSVAEEGIDIQACGSVIRWDPPQNMVSWAQSRGRARRTRSSFILMFEDGGAQQSLVGQWERLEAAMVAMYTDEDRLMHMTDDGDDDDGDDDEYLEFRIEETGALLTLDSAVSHLSHFCAVLPNSSHADHRPIYDIDPPDYPEGYHSTPFARVQLEPYPGPFGATVTLPKQVPPDQRLYKTDQVHPTKTSARRRVAFHAYVELYKAGLLNENLLPHTSVIEPDLDGEVKKLLSDIEKREGTASVTEQMDPWVPELLDASVERWWVTKISIDGISPITMLSRVHIPTLDQPESLYDTSYGRREVRIKPTGRHHISVKDLLRAKQYTRQLFFTVYGVRMAWDDLDFAYLFLPIDVPTDSVWEERRQWAQELQPPPPERFLVNALTLGERLSYPNDLFIVVDHRRQFYRFLGWRRDPLSHDELDIVRQQYSRFSDVEVVYPIIKAELLPTRMNFLVPTEKRTNQSTDIVYLLPHRTTVALATEVEVQLSILLPSILRVISIALTTHSLQATLFASNSLSSVPLSLLKVAIATPVASELYNYQRLETLGDTVLKFVIGIQLLSQFPFWHEGYLTRRKDHVVSNASLARGAIGKRLYRWIIRNRFIPRKWKPDYFDSAKTLPESQNLGDTLDDDYDGEETEGVAKVEEPQKSKSGDAHHRLSTKVLADVVESLIGAAYLNGGFEQSIECIRTFDLGLDLEPVPRRVHAIFHRTEEIEEIPAQLTHVERMLGYEFKKKVFLVEALMHASCQNDLRTVSYERMEFLGDSVLDMIVTELLYHSPGKQYSPGQLHMRKSALVNGHFLGFICLQCSLDVEAQMPKMSGTGKFTIARDPQKVFLWQCLLHSSSRILDDQTRTFDRYQRGHEEIEHALQNAAIYPWAALTRLQAPKFFSDMVESLIGAIYLDSNGDMAMVTQVLERLGILPILRRIVGDNVDVRHPVSRVANWAAQNHVEVEYKFEQEGGRITCSLISEKQVVISLTERFRGKASRDEVRFRVAEQGIEILTKNLSEKEGSF